MANILNFLVLCILSVKFVLIVISVQLSDMQYLCCELCVFIEQFRWTTFILNLMYYNIESTFEVTCQR